MSSSLNCMRGVRSAAFAIALGFAGPALAQSAPASGDSAGSAAVLKKPVTGEEVYHQVCQACHMADGKGATGAATIPALAGDPRLAAPAYPVMMVVNGRGAMPGFTDLLGPAQIAGVATYVRTHFGNSYAKPVTVEDVKPFLTGKK
jgi:mono/diheme cytochrome c family protein